MPTFKLIVAYDGTNYAGWARQHNAVGVQNVLEDALRSITGADVRTTGASRTDAGVHAFGQLVSLTTAKDIAAEDLCRALNAVLPDDVSVRSTAIAVDGFDAIRAARRKRYRYLIRDRVARGVFDRAYAWHLRGPLDERAMQEAGQALVGTHDFKSFQSAGALRQSTVRTIYELRVFRGGLGFLSHEEAGTDCNPSQEARGRELIAIEVEGNGFLYNMVRTIAGTLAEVGRGRRPVAWPSEVVAARNRAAAGQTAPPHGLFLLWVDCKV